MNIEELIVKHFPYPTFNEGQKEAIKAAVETFVSGKKHFILEAPTGIGKSAIAVTVHRVLDEISKNMGNRFRTSIVTPTHNLQDQYLSDFPTIDNLMGKKNYECPKGAGFYNSGPCRTLCSQGSCNKKKECPYIIARDHWANTSNLRTTNTSMQIEMCDMVCNKSWNRANLIILDEAHRLEDMLIKHCTLVIDVDDLKDFKNDKKGIAKSLIEFISNFDKISKGNAVVISKISSLKNALNRSDLPSKLFDALEDIRVTISDPEIETKTKTKFFELYETLEQLQDKVKLLVSGKLDTIMITDFHKNKSIEIRPVFAGEVSYYGLFRKADFFLHMSATIAGVEDYRKTLRIGKENYGHLILNNPIPTQNRPIFIFENFKMSNDSGSSRNTSRLINMICGLHEGQNGIVHTVSHSLAKDIVESCENPRLVLSSDLEEINEILSRKNGYVVVSPSIEEGIDLPDDMSRFQILAKTPFLYLGDPLISYKTKEIEGWYARKALIRMIQMCGRSIRGKSDFAKTYILDNTALRVLKDNSNITPRWFTKAILSGEIMSDKFKLFKEIAHG